MTPKNKILVHQNIINRRSPVIFSEKDIEEEKIVTLFEAAKWAPSSFNNQPWRFIYASKKHKQNYNKLLSCLFDENIEWAKFAPLLALSIAKKIYSNSKPNFYAQYETGMAVGNLLNQATHLGLYVHQMGGYDKNKAIENLKIPDNYEPMAMMAVGYLGEIDNFPTNLQEREKKPRTRKDLKELVFYGEFDSNS